MASGIVLSSAVRSNLITLQNTAELQGKVQERLSTGKRVNSALDNPSNFFTASGLNRRANDLSSLIDGMSQGIKTLEAADNAMRSITKTVETMQANIRQARQDKSFKGVSYTLDTVNGGTFAAKTLSFSGGAVGTTAVNVEAVTADVGGTRSSVVASNAYAPPTAATKASLTGTVALNTGTFAQAVDVTITYAGTDSTALNVSLANGSNRADALATIQSAIANSSMNGKITASLDGSNNLKLTAVNNADAAITVADNGTAGSATALVGASPASVTGSDGAHAFSVNGTTVTLTSQADVTSAVAKANADLGATHAVEAYEASGALAFRNKSSGTTPIVLANVAGSKAANTVAAGGLFTTSPAAGTAVTTPGGAKTLDQLVSDINANTSLAGKVRASNDGGKLRIENLSTEELTVVGATATNANGLTGASNTQKIGGNEIRKNLIGQFNELRRQLDKLADDSGFNGVNLLKADKMKVTFNEIGTSMLEIQAKDGKGDVRAINTTATSLDIGMADAAEFSDDALLDTRLDKLGNALTVLQTQSSSFGSSLSIVQIRQEFTKSMINTLEVGADNLTLADQNEEGANLLALNTRQQLSQTALSLAAQAQQAVLRLFG